MGWWVRVGKFSEESLGAGGGSLEDQGSERHQASAISGIRIGGLLAQVSGSIGHKLGGSLGSDIAR